MRQPHYLILLSIACSVTAQPAQTSWQPAQGPLKTRWTKEVSPKNAHPEYPRPQMVRKDWINLNGLWDYAIRPKDDARPAQFEGKLLVPFAVEICTTIDLGARRIVIDPPEGLLELNEKKRSG